jgi:hypothetical protein
MYAGKSAFGPSLDEAGLRAARQKLSRVRGLAGAAGAAAKAKKQGKGGDTRKCCTIM